MKDLMATPSVSTIWEHVDRAESFLVCSMFKEAASLASSIIQQLQKLADVIDDTQWTELAASAAMVYVQSMKELGRTKDLFIELKDLFGSVATIPVQVFLTGVCLQISDKSSASKDVRAILEEFLGKWKYEGDAYVIEAGTENLSDNQGRKQYIMSAENFIKVAEIYTISLLGTVLHDPYLAMSWAEKTAMPEENREIILRRLRSLSHVINSSSSSRQKTGLKPGQYGSLTIGSSPSETHGMMVNSHSRSDEDALQASPSKSIHSKALRMSDKLEPCLWWFRTIRFRFGNFQLVLSHGKLVLLSSLVVLIYYILQKKSTILKQLAVRRASSIKQVLVDAWQLAFSFQVNPLAAVQQVPSTPH